MTTLTTPEALALLDAEIAACGRLEPVDCDNCARIRQARAHLASRIAELEAELAAVRAAIPSPIHERGDFERGYNAAVRNFDAAREGK